MTASRILCEYDGTHFAGWARQPGLRTVQGELEAALQTLLRQPVQLTVAGRTDRGVHAWGRWRATPARRPACAGSTSRARPTRTPPVAPQGAADEPLQRGHRARADQDARSRAPRRLARVADRVDRLLLAAHAASFGVVNGSLVGLWAATGQGDFWPAVTIAPWSVVLAWHAGGSWSIRRMLRRRTLTVGADRRRRLAA